MVPSATPPQLASVGAWVTMMPRSVAASTSTSSMPTVYLATMHKESELSRILREIGLERIEDPMRAALASARRHISSSLSPWGVCQDALPSTTRQPASSSFW